VSATEAILYLAITLVGICFSALFSGMETGIYTINRVRLSVRAGRKEAAALRLSKEIQHSNRLLATLLVGNNLANYAGSYGIAAILATLGYGEWAVVALNAIVLTPMLFVFGETLPKDLFRTHTDVWTYRLIRFLVFLRRVFTFTLLVPLVQGVGALASRALGEAGQTPVAARQRMSQLIREGVGAGVLSEAQMTLADRALAMRHRRLAGEMVPWRHVVKLPLDASPSEREALIRRINYTRLPVVDRRGEVAGVLSTIDAVVDRDKPTRDLMYEPFRLPTNLPVASALKEMRAAKRNMAIAFNPATGRTVGIVTLKDLVEPLTGELAAW